MEFLQQIGDFFNSFTSWFERVLTRLFGSSNERMIHKLGFVRKGEETSVTPGSLLESINKLEPEYEKLTDDELRESAPKFRARLAEGETLDDLLPEVFAAAREAGKRFLKMRHYDVQLIGGYILHKGMISEMVTGEGKTLVATLAIALNAMAGHVHLVTVNDYLARRDMEWMSPLYQGLGLTVGAIQGGMDPHERHPMYACDITYGTNNEFGFDYLRDNMKPTKELQAQGPLQFAVVDEIDNILIDEARTPLIISGPAYDDVRKYAKANSIAVQLKKGVHFEIKEKEHSCHLTEDGIRRGEELAGVESFYTSGNMEWPHLIDNSLKAHFLYKRDVNYVVQNDEIVIVDEFTGRLMPGRNWSDGLHQAVEAKEGVKIKEENQTLATITLQNFFKLYETLAGMTGTAMTEAAEFWKIYKLDVVAVPTNRPLERMNFPDVVYRSEDEKYAAIVGDIREVHETGRPILVGTVSIEKSELLSDRLGKFGIKHEILNAKHHEREADIIAQAGRLGAVTIATNMAGRGTDIVLGGNPEHIAWELLKQKYENRLEVPKAEFEEVSAKIAEEEGMVAEGREVAKLGGLHVIGTERHEARRIDLQLRGRAGRQGDPGSSRFYLSLEDDLMRVFAGDWVKGMLTRLGMQEGEAIESRMVARGIERAQKKVEERNFDVRKNLLEYDEVMDQQRHRVYSYRQHILDGGNCRRLIIDMVADQVRESTYEMLAPAYGRETCVRWAGSEFGIELDASDINNMRSEEVRDYLVDQAERQSESLILDKIDEDLPEEVEDKREWNWGNLSKWANARWGLNTNDRELRKIGREKLFEYLSQRAREAIGRFKFDAVDQILSDEWGRQQLCGWLAQRFGLLLPPDEIKDLEIDDTTDLVIERLEDLYRGKEIDFPVSVGLNSFLSSSGGGGEKYNREGLVQWANNRFSTELTYDDLKGKQVKDIRDLLTDCSRSYFHNGDLLGEVDDILDEAYGELNGDESGNGAPQHPEVLDQLNAWSEKNLHAPLETDALQKLSRDTARQAVLNKIDDRFRPELCQAERALLLEVLDTAWKDHLYYMDHLRQGVGLMGYAQKDPKVEYKREGMKAFESMWRSIGDQVTSSIYRLEEASPEFVGSLWQVTATTKEAAPSPDSYADESSPGQNAGAPDTVEPIRNKGERVGRNAPCPCGSGKKYKKCHGARG